MKILHVCAGWQQWNGAANIARMIMDEQRHEGHEVSFTTWAKVRELRAADEVWIHCGWLPCLWWAAIWGRNVHWMPEACYDPVRLHFHGWKKWFVGSMERWCLRRCDRIVATCEAEKGWIEKYLGKRCPAVEVTDVKRFFKLGSGGVVKNSQLMTHDSQLHLLYLGRRHPLKGVEYLGTAVRQIQDSSAYSASYNFGLVIAEALERGKRVITTDGAPAWGGGNDYGGRLVFLKGFRDGTDKVRVGLLKDAIAKLVGMDEQKRMHDL